MNLKQLLLYTAVGLLIGAAAGTAFWLVFSPYRDIDILISNGTVVDGTGSSPRLADIGIRDGKIVEVSRWRFYLSRAKLHIDARDRIVSPGFIDAHTHVERNIPQSAAFQAENFLRQGVTTLITGNCGRSRTDIAALFRGLEKNGTYINVATLVGHNSVRQEVMGVDARDPTTDELNRLRGLVERAINDGAVGFSTGLEYVPGRFAKTSELIALAKEAGSNGALYATHIRNEGPRGVEAIREALEIARQAGAALEISHFKSSGLRQWRTIGSRLALLDEARSRGQNINIDVYPYTRSSTTTDILLPDWAVKDHRSGLRQVSTSGDLRQRLHADIVSSLTEEGWKDLLFVRLVAGRPEWIGKTLGQVPVAAQNLNEQVENLIDISLRGGAQAVFDDMDEQDVAQVTTYAYSVFGSDSAVRTPSSDYLPHPRGYGTFPRIFSRYVREEGLLSLESAINKASGQAAEVFHLASRGTLTPGNWADVVVFDLDRIQDKADYDQPFAYPLGIDYVIVNGVIAVDHGNLTSNSPSGMPVRFHSPRR